MSRDHHDQHRRWVSALAVLLFVLVWELVCQLQLVEPILLSSPSRIAVAGYRLAGTGALTSDLWFTLQVFVTSLTIATILGVALGFLIGYSPWAYDALNPFIVTASSLPKIVLMPLIVLWLGIGFSANVFLATLMGSFPIIVSVHGGIRSLERDFITLARAYGASRTQLLRAIVLPGITPFVLAGLRVAVSYAMVGALIAEFFASSQGLGYRMVLYMANFRVDEFFVCMVLVAAVTLVGGAGVHWLERRVEAWRPPAFQRPGM